MQHFKPLAAYHAYLDKPQYNLYTLFMQIYVYLFTTSKSLHPQITCQRRQPACVQIRPICSAQTFRNLSVALSSSPSLLPCHLSTLPFDQREEKTAQTNMLFSVSPLWKLTAVSILKRNHVSQAAICQSQQRRIQFKQKNTNTNIYYTIYAVL